LPSQKYPVAHPPFEVQEKAEQPNLLDFQLSFGTDLLACIPGRPTFSGWAIYFLAWRKALTLLDWCHFVEGGAANTRKFFIQHA